MYFSVRGRWYVLAAVVAGVGVIFGVLFSPLFQSELSYVQKAVPAVVEEVSAAAEPLPALPVRLVIPAIGVDAVVQYVGLEPHGGGDMDVPSNFVDVGWYEHGVRPGMRGSAVIAGHYNGREVAEAVFYDLSELQVGDEVMVVTAAEVEEVFVVVKLATYDYNDSAVEVFVGTDQKKRLNLITCGGEWLSQENQFNERMVVFTEAVTQVD